MEEGYKPVTAYKDLLEAIKKRAIEIGASNYYIAKKGKVPETTVIRMMAGDSEVKLSTILAVCEVLEIEVSIKFKPQ
jgi:predicted transcriptional regulator